MTGCRSFGNRNRGPLKKVVPALYAVQNSFSYNQLKSFNIISLKPPAAAITMIAFPTKRWSFGTLRNGNMRHVHLFWLGQAGFAIRFRDTLIVVEPYLSDYLAGKYQNAEFKHRRMIPPPIMPKEAAVAGWVLSTHKHSDHLDPWTVSGMVAANPDLRIIVPAKGHDVKDNPKKFK